MEEGMKIKHDAFFHRREIEAVEECDVITGLSVYLLEEIEWIQRSVQLRTIFPDSGYRKALEEAGIPTLVDRRDLLYSYVVAMKDHKLAKLLPLRSCHHRQVRNMRVFDTQVCKTDLFNNFFYYLP